MRAVLNWLGWLSPPPLPKAYWWAEQPNWGDRLAPLLLERFAGLKTEWGTVSHSRIMTVGSILEHCPPLWDGVILGTGKLREDSQLHLHTRTATILGVRGPLTARQCPMPGTYALGDPGLMASELVTNPEKIYDLGIVPHWSDTQLAAREEFHGRGAVVKVIDPRGDPISVITQIASCHRVVTSSLHGAIVADAFEIPRRVEPGGATWTRDGTFKWRDYSASLGTTFTTGRMVEVNRMQVDERRFELFDAYTALGALVRKHRW